MKNIFQKIKQEFLNVLPPTLFFLFAFNVVALTSVLMAEQHGIEVPPIITATILALVVGKVILLVDHLPFINRFPDKPLIYNVVWKTFIYMAAVMVVRYFEHLIPLARETGSLVVAHQHILDAFVWRKFVAIQVWLLVLFLFYSVLLELFRALGRERVLRMFFG